MRIGLGLAALGRPAYITLGRDQDLGSDRSIESMERRCHQVLDAAYEAGVRYFDAAASYGFAEQFVSSWLRDRRVPPGKLRVGSKWGYTYVGGWRMEAPVHEVKDLSVATLTKQIADARSRLGKHLTLYQIHSATLESGVLEDRAVLGELVRLRDEGLRIGLTVTGPRQADVVRRAMDVAIDGVNPFQSVQATWNLLETSAGPALRDAHDRGWGVIVKEALANGRLTERSSGSAIAELRARARDLGTTCDAAAIAAVLSNPWVDVVLSGAVTVDHLRSNLRALDLVREGHAAIDWPVRAEPPDEYWTVRRSLEWA